MEPTLKVRGIVDDEDIQNAIVRLNDALCAYERDTGVEHVFIVAQIDGPGLHVSDSGKPIWDSDVRRDALSEYGPLGVALRGHGILSTR